MGMTKKDFVALADALRSHWHEGISPAARIDIIAFCQAQNPRFMTVRWLEYVKGKAGPCGGKRKA